MKSQTKLKQTEIGMIPEDWELVEFLELLSEKTRNGIYKQKQFHGEGVKIINMKELFAYSRIGNQDMKRVKLDNSEMSRFLVHKGDLLFARRSLVAEGSGKCALIVEHSEPITFESSIILARPDMKSVDSEFLYYFFSSPKGRQIMGTILRQVAVSGITGTDLMKLKIIKPPILDQQSIAKILSDLDSKIELNNQMNKTLEAIGQAIFKYWFVDFEFPNEEGKPYNSSGGEMVYNEELRKEIPKGWRIGKFSDILYELESGSRPKGGATITGIPSIGAENILGLGLYDYSSTKFVPPQFYDEMKQGKLKDFDVLLYKDGAQIGRKSIFGLGFPFSECCVNEHVFILRVNPPMNQFYLYFWTNLTSVTNEIMNLNSNSAQPGINREDVKGISILIPDENILKIFENMVMPIIKKIFNNCLENQTLSKTRDSLLPKLMSGKIRVSLETKK